MANALGAPQRIDLVNLIALVDRAIGTLRLANIAIDALIGDQQGHGIRLVQLLAVRPHLFYLVYQGLVDLGIEELADIPFHQSDFFHQGS